MLRPLLRRLRRTFRKQQYRLFGKKRALPWSSSRRRRQQVHVRAFQRSNSEAVVTTVQGLPARPEPAAVLKALKKELGCGGSLVQDPKHGQVLYLQGDQRARARAYLVDDDRGSGGGGGGGFPPHGGNHRLDPRAVVVHKGCEQQVVCPQCGYWEPRKAQRWKLWTKCKSCGHRQWFRR